MPDIMGQQSITFDSVSAGYHGVDILKDISFSLDAGEMVALIGPNGSGKTTLFRVLSGYQQCTAGTISLFGTNLSQINTRDRARLVALVPQELQVPVSFSVEELVMIGRTASLNRWSYPSATDHQIVERAMSYTDVIDLRAHPVLELSGGEKQRAAIAMALAQEPKIILLDEITSHLDMNHRLGILQIIERLNRESGTTVVMTSHDLNIAAEFCGRMLLLDAGHLQAKGSPREVLKPDLLRKVYDCDVDVRCDSATGLLTVRPAQGLAAGDRPEPMDIFVIGGGGAGQEILRRLSLAGHRLTCGVTNQGDTDDSVAEALGARSILEKPFSPITLPALERAIQCSENASAVVLASVFFGPGNLPNIEIAEKALNRGTAVFIATEHLDSRDFSEGQTATARIRRMVEAGACEFETGTELFRAISQL